MHYLYHNFPFGRHSIRYVRLPNFPTHTTAYREGAAFHSEGELPSASASLPTHDLYRLRQLREQQATEKRLVYFDIADAQLSNPKPDLADFETWVGSEDTHEWQLTSNHLVL